jgi:signal recognition particle subunit SRP54
VIFTVLRLFSNYNVVGDSIGVEVYSEPENKNPVEIAQNAIKHAKQMDLMLLWIQQVSR